MKTIQCDINQFCPELRAEAESTLQFFNTEVPPFGPGNVTILVSDTYELNERGVRKMDTMAGKGYGLTASDPMTGNSFITLTAQFFGVNADVAEYRKHIDADLAARFHGNMQGLRFQIAHEYGHAFDEMCRQFIRHLDEDERVKDAYQTMFEAADRLRFSTSMISRILHPHDVVGSPEKPYAGKLVSGYAETSPPEFFAETFAAVYCDPAEGMNETVVLMKRLIQTVKEEIAKTGEELVNNPPGFALFKALVH